MANIIIEPGLRADIMRKQMETKNQLTEAGDLYVGTGLKDTVGNVNIYKTDVLHVGDSHTVLKVGANRQLEYGLITSENILHGSISPDKLADKFNRNQIDNLGMRVEFSFSESGGRQILRITRIDDED